MAAVSGCWVGGSGSGSSGSGGNDEGGGEVMGVSVDEGEWEPAVVEQGVSSGLVGG